MFSLEPSIPGTLGYQGGPATGGTLVTIHGQGFSTASAVYFGSTRAPSVHIDSDSEITATSPPGTGAVIVTVQTACGNQLYVYPNTGVLVQPINATSCGTSASTGAGVFGAEYYYIPVLTSISPAVGLPSNGTQVTISGQGLAASGTFAIQSVQFGSVSVDVDSSQFGQTMDGTTITLTTPAQSAGSVDVQACGTITNPGSGGNTVTSHFCTEPGEVTFTYVDPPTVSCGTPDSNWHGDDVSITCTTSGLDEFGGALANPDDASFSLTTTVPDGTETDSASTNSHQVCNLAGLCVTAGPITGIKVDKKAPTVTCDSPDSSWHASDVSLNCIASDGGSGLANASDARFTLSTSVPNGTETDDASTGSHQVCDAVLATASLLGRSAV